MHGGEERAPRVRGAGFLAAAALAAGLLLLTSCVVLPVRTAPAVDGMVVDQATGNPVSDALVVVRFDGRYDDVLPDRDLIGHQEARSDASGRFRMEQLVRAGLSVWPHFKTEARVVARDARGLPLRGAAGGSRERSGTDRRSRRRSTSSTAASRAGR